MGRPSIQLNEAMQLRICEAFRVGASVAHAAKYAGVSRKTLQRWIKRGKTQENSACRQLWQDIEKARAELVISLLLRINHAASKNWKAAAWKLERLYPKLYGKSAVADADENIDAEVEDADQYPHTADEGLIPP